MLNALAPVARNEEARCVPSLGSPVGSPVFSEGIDDVVPSIIYLRTDSVETIEHEGRKLEVWLRDPKNGNTEPKIMSTTGTGFLVKRGTRTFLVTAQHVASSLTARSIATLRLPDKSGRVVPLKKFLLGEWRMHPSADAAAVEIAPSLEGIELSNSALSYELISPEPVTPSRSLRLAVIGFPLSLGLGKTVSPITRETMAASGPLDLPRFDNHVVSAFFLLQDPSVGGFSGSPVCDFHLPSLYSGEITFRSGGVICYGLVHGTISDNTGGKFAAIVPSIFIRQLIDQWFSGK